MGTKSEVNIKLAQLAQKKQQIEEQLMTVENQIYNLETAYLEETSGTGNVVKGWEAYLSGRRQNYAQTNKYRTIKPSERIFSKSSVTSPDVCYSIMGYMSLIQYAGARCVI